MNKLFLFGLTILYLTGCSISGTKEPADANKPVEVKTEQKKDAKFNVGETVVAKWMQNSFYEGKVESVTDAKVKVKWNDGSNPSEVDLTDAFTLPKVGEKPDVKVGDIVLAKVGTGSYWNGAEITKIEGDVFGVKILEGQASNVSPEKIIKIPAAVAANFKDKASSMDFLKEAHSKKPVVTVGFKPKEGETVLGEWTVNGWYQAKVQKVSGDKAVLAWEDGTKPSEVVAAKILPLPDAKSELPKENDFVLVKPVSGSKWVYAQTVSVKDGKVEVKQADGQIRSLKAGDFILLK